MTAIRPTLDKRQRLAAQQLVIVVFVQTERRKMAAERRKPSQMAAERRKPSQMAAERRKPSGA